MAMIVGIAPSLKHNNLEGYCARRLARLANVDTDQLWELFHRTNLIKRFPGRKVVKTGNEVYRKHMSHGDIVNTIQLRSEARKMNLRKYKLVVLLGAATAKAFGYPPSLLKTYARGTGTTLVVMPHPSGVSHFWNNKCRTQKASQFLRTAMIAAGICAPRESNCFSKYKYTP